MAKQVYDEIQVLRSCAGGDSAAFEAIVSKYQSLVCAITYSAVGQVDKSEELAQQAFINAWQNLAQLQDLDMFKAWL
ncbi:MAG: RNA polymerase sigma factor, partial [Planctomycetota bacterium]